MHKVNVTILSFAALFATNIVRAQGDGCPGVKFPYSVVVPDGKGGCTTMDVCLLCPLQSSQPPLMLHVHSFTYSLQTGGIVADAPCLTGLTSELDDCINNAVSQWCNVCPSLFTAMRVSTSPGTFNIATSTDPNDFKTPLDSKGINADMRTNIIIGASTTACADGQVDYTQTSTTFVNFTAGYLDRSTWVHPCPSTVISACNDPGLIHQDFCQIILHEIGHWFGLADVSDNPHCTSGTDYSGMAMWGSDNGLPCKMYSISHLDVCYFQRLYCPTAACMMSVEPIQKSLGTIDFSMMPNPAANTVDISFMLPTNNRSTLQLYDILGRSLRNYELKPGVQDFDLDLTGLDNGAYIVDLETVSSRVQHLLHVIK